MNVLVTGGGSIGQRHIKNLQTLGYNDIWVLKRADDAEFAAKYAVHVVTSYEEADLLDFDVIIVATPTALHNESLAFAVQKGLHVFMEKPLIHDRQGLDDAKALMLQSDHVFFIGFMLRYHPLVKQLKELIAKQVLGYIYNARFSFGSYLPYWHPWEDYKTSYASRNELGGGVINTITHELDLIQFFFGTPQQVYCEASNFGLLDIPVEEHCEATLSYPGKVVTLHLDYLQKDYDRNIQILCEEGKIVWNWHEHTLHIHPHKGEHQTIRLEPDYEINHLYLDELKAFFGLIDQQQYTHPLDFKHAVLNTELTLLLHESAKAGRKLSYE